MTIKDVCYLMYAIRPLRVHICILEIRWDNNCGGKGEVGVQNDAQINDLQPEPRCRCSCSANCYQDSAIWIGSESKKERREKEPRGEEERRERERECSHDKDGAVENNIKK